MAPEWNLEPACRLRSIQRKVLWFSVIGPEIGSPFQRCPPFVSALLPDQTTRADRVGHVDAVSSRRNNVSLMQKPCLSRI